MGARVSAEMKRALRLCQTMTVREVSKKTGMDTSGLYKALKKQGVTPITKKHQKALDNHGIIPL